MFIFEFPSLFNTYKHTTQ